MSRLVTPALLSLGLVVSVGAIAPRVLAQNSAPNVITTATYRCDQGKGFTVQYRDNQTARATFGSKTVELPQVESASGARYSDGSITLFTKGDTAFVDVGDQRVFANCTTGGSVSGRW